MSSSSRIKDRLMKRALSRPESEPEKDMDREGGLVEVNVGESADSAGEPSDSGERGISGAFIAQGSAIREP